ncbi:MAG: ATP-binding cassette domain-containing protein [bacterium]
MALLEIQNLVVHYPRPGGAPVEALKGISLQVAAGESLGIVGESGCGKSTLARAIVGLVLPRSGRIVYDGEDVSPRDRVGRERYCRQVQMVFQDATGSLNPRMTVGAMLDEVLRVHKIRPAGAELRKAEDGSQRTAAVVQLLDQVGLPPEAAAAYARELSGGQCQRVSLARCLALGPRLLVADEPVSALDVSVQARVLNLLRELQQQLGLALLLVSHDLAVVRTVCDRVCVLYDGLIVEQGTVAEVLEHPAHPYTRELLAAVPDVDRALAARAHT